MSLIKPLLVVGVIAIAYLVLNKKQKKEPILDKENDVAKKRIDKFIIDIITDYEKEYKHNFLSTRYNLEAYKIEGSYVFKTKYISSLEELLSSSEDIVEGETYLSKLIFEKYNNKIDSVFKQLTFITDISRIEGKIKAVESIKPLINSKDYTTLLNKLLNQKQTLINKCKI